MRDSTHSSLLSGPEHGAAFEWQGGALTENRREEFRAVTDPQSHHLELRLAEWQHYYNWTRPHGSLNGQTPIDALSAKQETTPFLDEVEALYDPTGERFQVTHYQIDLALRRHAPASVRAQEK